MSDPGQASGVAGSSDDWLLVLTKCASIFYDGDVLDGLVQSQSFKSLSPVG